MYHQDFNWVHDTTKVKNPLFRTKLVYRNKFIANKLHYFLNIREFPLYFGHCPKPSSGLMNTLSVITLYM